ncbi:hypothetical protein BBJ28_00019249 [Nothophytophthora sp. Chile5]|nr:hypothetical protein BBJ28_00019249 [Nothophytophthora sp. Chile5]
MEPRADASQPESSSTRSASEKPQMPAPHVDVVTVDPPTSSAATPPPASGSWLEIKQLSVDSDAQQRSNRKRQRPATSPSSSGLALGAPSALADSLKLDFAGFQVGTATSTPSSPPAFSFPSAIVEEERPPHEVVDFLGALRLTLDASMLPMVAERLAVDGFDSLAALAFATVEDLQRAGLARHLADCHVVCQQSRRVFSARRFQGPGVLSNSSFTVSRWLALCAIPKTRAFEYAEFLRRLGYSSVRDLELILHDQRAIAVFRLGHSRLLVHCVTAALTAQAQQQQTSGLGGFHYANGPNVYAAGSSSALLQPLDIQRENEFDVQAYDSFLEALIEPTDAERLQQQQQRHPLLSRENEDANRSHNLLTTSDVFGGRLSFGGVSAAASPASNVPLRLLPQEHLQLLYEAVNLPRPNPCRRGKKIYWSVLATGGMKEERFARLAQFTAAELQNAYLRQFELPASTPVKMDAWSDDNIRQLEHAVKDPRCRHLSKVCWEMLATGRTGVDEYAPLAKFTASQLRSRFRSLFGDKRPQKLRQKKQMLKMQQQQQQESEAQQQAAALENERSI